MTRIPLLRAIPRPGVSWRVFSRVSGETTVGWRDKSACPECAKPLTRLAFSRACRSVAGMLPDFGEHFQCSRMQRLLAIPLEALP